MTQSDSRCREDKNCPCNSYSRCCGECATYTEGGHITSYCKNPTCKCHSNTIQEGWKKDAEEVFYAACDHADVKVMLDFITRTVEAAVQEEKRLSVEFIASHKDSWVEGAVKEERERIWAALPKEHHLIAPDGSQEPVFNAPEIRIIISGRFTTTTIPTTCIKLVKT